MVWLIGTRIGRLAAALGGLLATGLALFLAGHRDGRRNAAETGLRRYHETRQEMDHADASRGDAADDREWLHKRAQR